MPLSFAPATVAQMASGRSAERDMILFDFPSGLWGFWSGLCSISPTSGSRPNSPR